MHLKKLKMTSKNIFVHVSNQTSGCQIWFFHTKWDTRSKLIKKFSFAQQNTPNRSLVKKIASNFRKKKHQWARRKQSCPFYFVKNFGKHAGWMPKMQMQNFYLRPTFLQAYLITLCHQAVNANRGFSWKSRLLRQYTRHFFLTSWKS